MKTPLLRFVTFVSLSSALFSFCGAANEYAEILKERDAVLSKILAAHEARFAIGHANEDALFSARVALYSFRRDTAAARAEKIKQQELIVDAHERRLTAV